MMDKKGKIEFVQRAIKELDSHKLVGVVGTNNLPDRLVQSTKNRLKPTTRFIMGRKTLLAKILEGSKEGKSLVKDLTGTSAIVLSDEDPFKLYGMFKAGVLKLSAKPGQIAPNDVPISSGETSIMPGQTVTELKSAGIDVQIQKGKVVISKDKVLVKKGETISPAVAKALRILDITPFEAVMDPSAFVYEHISFGRNALSINADVIKGEIAVAFKQALSISMSCNIINQYTINSFIAKAYSNALYLGVEAGAFDSGVIERLISKAALCAAALSPK